VKFAPPPERRTDVTEATVTKQKVSEFLGGLDPWGIYTHEDMAADFKEKTGLEADWPSYSVRETARAITERGLGGTLGNPGEGKHLAYGYTTAVHLAEKLVPGFRSTKMGRGSAFHEAVAALVKVGL
jgi:hypothetical protein